MRVLIVAEHYRSTEPLTTGSVARMLERTSRAVRWMAQTGRLAGRKLRSGQWLFIKGDVELFMARRSEARLSGVRVLRPKRYTAPGQPQQLALFGPTVKPRMAKAVLRLVRGKSLPDAEVQFARLARN